MAKDRIDDVTGTAISDDPALQAATAELARLREQTRQDRAALQHLQRRVAVRNTGSAAPPPPSLLRAAARLARRLLARRRPAPARPPPAATAAVPHELTATAPAVSLVVLGAAHLPPVLARTAAGLGYEVLLPTPPGANQTRAAGVRWVAAAAGDTLAARCNAAATLARGEWIAFWHAGMSPHPGWLAALADCLATTGQAGMAGASLLTPAGRIAAAGAAIAADGALLPLHAGQPETHPACASVEPVAANLLGCVMLSAPVWHRFGGLDSEIAALDHAFAELGQRLRAAGLRVLRQPFARLTGPANPAPDPWAEAYGRWRLRQTCGDGMALLGLPAPAPPRALFFDHNVPTPDRDSGSADIVATMRIFVGLGWQVTLLPHSELAAAGRYVDDLRRAGIRVVADGWAAHFTDVLAREPTPFDLLVVHRGSLAVPDILDPLLAHSPQAKLVFATVDLHFLRMEREALLRHSAAGLQDAWRMQQSELAAIVRADCSILVSQAEQRLISALLPHARTCVIPIMRDIPGRGAPFAPRHGVLFVGSFRHRPNVDAIVSFVREVWPLVRQRLDTELTVVGADPPDEVRALAGADIRIAGHVADLDAVLAACRLTVAPLRYGAGIKGKVVSSLAAGVPCVASPLAVEGMDLPDGSVRVADTPADFAAAVVAVHEQAGLWQALSEHGLRAATENFSVAAGRRRIIAMLHGLTLPA